MKRPRRAPAIALGILLARRGPLAVVSMLVSVVTAAGLALLALAFARRGADAPVQGVPLLASSAIVWGGAFLQAVAVSAGALRRDRSEGIRHLLVTRTTSLRGYLLARVGGLATVLAVVAGGGTLLVSAVALLGATQTQALGPTLKAALGALLYSVAFAVVIAPVAFAALGARARVSGYFFLLLVLVVPEMLAGSLGARLPSEVTELCAIPSALAALRASIAPGALDPLRLVRSTVALAVFTAAATLLVRRDLLLLEREEP